MQDTKTLSEKKLLTTLTSIFKKHKGLSQKLSQY